jgi:hypothetical protein
MPLAPPPIKQKLNALAELNKAAKKERDGALLFGTHTETLAICSQEKMSRMDYIMTDLYTIRAIVEVKGRDMSYDRLQNYGSYLISDHKILSGKQASMLMGAPFVLVAALTDGIVYWKITDGKGNRLFPYETDIRKMQKRVEGGEKSDRVALLPLDKMSELIPWGEVED